MTTTRTTTSTVLAVVGPSAVVLAAVAATAAVAGPGLPASVAVHFGSDGRADGWGSPWLLFWLGAAAATAALVVAVVALRMRDRRTGALLVLVTSLLGPVLGGAWVSSAWTAHTDPDHLSPWWIPVLLGAGVVAAAIAVPPLVRSAPPVPVREVAPLPVAPDARVAWRAHVGSGWFVFLGVAVIVLGIVIAVPTATVSVGSAVFAGVTTLVVGAAVVALARVDVTVDRRGLRVVSTWTRLPIMRVPLDRIEACGWEHVSPGAWGGWGYRVSGRGIAYVTRSGPGIVVRLRGGTARVVTVDDAERGAAALGTLLAPPRTA